MPGTLTAIELAKLYNLNTSNFHATRKERAKRLCEHLGGCAVYSPSSINPGYRTTYFASFDEAMADLDIVASSKSVRFFISEVIKCATKWAVMYKVEPLDKAQSVC